MPFNSSQLPSELEEWRARIEEWAKDYGLDFYQTIFEVLDWNEMNMVAAYGGFPNRYPHWRFGMEYDQLAKSYAYGLSKIYEMVINNDPCYAYLLHCNKMIDQKMVMAHVFGHCDFFKNNTYFGPTPKNMMDQMANHKTRVVRLIDRLGFDRVENFIDVCLSLENLIDYQLPFTRPRQEEQQEQTRVREAEEDVPRRDVDRLRVDKPYLESYINPPSFLDEQRQRREKTEKQERKFPSRPDRDVMGFLLNYAPLERWEYDILDIIRREAYYFAPQAQTKIMNEGWASYWHSTIMTRNALTSDEFIDFADHHSGTMAMSSQRINPYKIGIELFRHIEERWDKGQCGKEYDECDDIVAKKNWDKQWGQGRAKIFSVRKIYNDVTFIDEFFTAEFCRQNKLFAYTLNPLTQRYEISDRDFAVVKQKILQSLTNFGQPRISVVDANHGNRAELKLIHEHEGMDLDVSYAQETLKNLFAVWKRPVLIESRINDQIKLYKFDGGQHSVMDSAVGL